MKNFPPAIAILLLSAFAVFAQSTSTAPSYRIDNFDLASGVRITLPPPPPSKQQLRKGRRTSAKLNHSSASVPLHVDEHELGRNS